MATFRYIALDAGGKRIRGELAGASEQAVLSELEGRRLLPITIEQAEQAASKGKNVSPRRLGQTYLQLADLLRAGVPLLRSLKLLGGRKSDPAMAAAFRELAESVADGGDLAEAMSRRPRVFPSVHVAMVRAGERGGFLEKVVERLGQLVTSQAELRGKVIGSLVYPALLAALGSIALTVIFIVFVPQFRVLFESVPDLPTVTKLVLALSDLVSRWWMWTLIALAAGVFAVRWVLKRPTVREKIEYWRTFAPLIGPLTRSLAAARFCRMLGTMLDNGVPLLAAMQIAKETAGNRLMERAIASAAESVRSGRPLAPPMGESGLFDDDIIEMISVGESANNLDHVLITIAETIEKRVDRLLTSLVKLIEPSLLLVMAGLVATVAIALILPMTKLGQ
ncbi:MAG: type II secretion system F family protein [Phycisphaerales bacterium]|nr:type II secretion system F family protein [Phycisphaerales bacterium]